jgi:hypothetical protein
MSARISLSPLSPRRTVPLSPAGPTSADVAVPSSNIRPFSPSGVPIGRRIPERTESHHE